MTIILQGWLWHQITREGWYAIIIAYGCKESTKKDTGAKTKNTKARKNFNNCFGNNFSTDSQNLWRRILEGVRAKNLEATILFVDFTKVFDSIHRGNMEQILLAYGLTKETVTAIMMLYRNTKVKVRSPDGYTDYFDNVAGVLQGDTLASYLFICLDYMLRTSIDKMKENGFKLTKERTRRYPAQTITDADDLALLVIHLPKPCYIVWNEQLQA